MEGWKNISWRAQQDGMVWYGWYGKKCGCVDPNSVRLLCGCKGKKFQPAKDMVEFCFCNLAKSARGGILIARPPIDQSYRVVAWDLSQPIDAPILSEVPHLDQSEKSAYDLPFSDIVELSSGPSQSIASWSTALQLSISMDMVSQ